MMAKPLWQSNPVRGFVVLLLVFSCLYRLGGTNPLSRLMALCAMSEYRTFRVDAYVQPSDGPTHPWGDDWARTPDGHYYSNKAPGPMLLAFPVFWAYDRLVTAGLGSPPERDAFRFEHRQSYLFLLSLVLQVVPVALLVLALSRFLESRWDCPPEAILAFAAALLFGNPASFFFSSFFGHGFAAWLTLALGVSLYLRRPLPSGFFFGLALLSDYGTLFIAPALLLAVVLFIPHPSRFLAGFMTGAFSPAVLWVFYHVVCFGSPFALPNAFQNPIYRDMEGRPFSIWGVFVPIPDASAALQLLVGKRRGVFIKSPWVAVTLAWVLTHRTQLRGASPDVKALATFSVGSLLGLFYMNACFGGWDGGAVPVARYLSASFPLLALMAASVHSAWTRWWRRALLAGIVAACGYFLYYNVFRLPATLRGTWGLQMSHQGWWAHGAEWAATAGFLIAAAYVGMRGRVRTPGTTPP